MSYNHRDVYIVRVADIDHQGETRSWFVGPDGSSRADQVADDLESTTRKTAEKKETGALWDRQCFVEPLWSNDDCLRVADYERATEGSLY